jgi:pSer/pThr/pTyr-binding forkhead associated (FHA) protein/tetratricopeptide (TPR) repeat protein
VSAVLVITRDKIQVKKLALSTPRFVIGRSKSCDLPLNDAIMSRQHCIIVESGGAYTIEDNGSRNGTEVNGSHISGATPLGDGDKIVLGPFELTFYSSGGEAIVESEDLLDEDAATRFAGADDLQKAQKTVHESQRPVSSGAIVRIDVTSGPLKGETYKDWHGDLVIGRASENDIILPDDAASTRHARIFKDSAGAYYLEDFGSSNGTFVDNVRIRERKPLKDGAKIRIGTTVMEYHESDPVQQKAARRKILIAGVIVLFVVAVAAILRPDDPTPGHLTRADDFLSLGEYDNAISAYEDALKSSPDNTSAQAGINEANSRKEALVLVGQAKKIALQEDYLGAEDLLHQAGRLHSENEEAREMLAVIGKIREAKIAEDAQNWPDAIRLIEKALETYPDSEVLQSGLKRATSERDGQIGLMEVDNLVGSKRYTEAAALLREVNESSTYYEKARIKLALVVKMEQAEKSLQAALNLFLGGDEIAALDEIRVGQEIMPDYDDLSKLYDDIKLLSPLKKRMEKRETLISSTNPEEVWQMIKDCDAAEAYQIHTEELIEFQVEAKELTLKLRGRLRDLSGEAYVAGRKAEARGNQQEALKQYNIAIQANPSNEDPAAAMEDLRKVLDPLVKEHFQQGLVHEELNQIDLAVSEYREVLGLAIPSDSYYQRAQKRLKVLE